MSLINVGLSVFAFFLILSIMSGMNQTIHRRILSLTPHLTLTFPHTEREQSVEEALSSVVEKNSGVELVGSFEKQDLIVRTVEGQFRGVQGYGLDEKIFSFIYDHIEKLDAKNRPREIKYSLGYETPGEDEVLLGSDLARALGVLDGEEITLITPESFISGAEQAFKARRVVVRHILATQVEELDSQYVYYQREVTLNSFKNSSSHVNGYEFWFYDLREVEKMKKKLQSLFPKALVATWKEKNSALFLALRLEKTMIGLFLGMAGLLSGFSITTVMILLISQKRRDIAVMKAIGLSDKKIIFLFSKVGVLLGLMGIVPGLLFSLVLSLYIEKFPIQILPDIYYDSTIPAYVDFKFFFVTFFVAMILCLIAAYGPARKTLDVEPAQVLKGN